MQPPLTLLLARQLRLEPAFSGLPPLPAQIARNMAFASVCLPTSTGILVALAADEVVMGSCMQHVAWMLAFFWTWRLYRQTKLGPLLPKAWHWGLCAIFFTQGPLFAIALMLARRA